MEILYSEVSDAELLEKNRIYDEAAGALWRTVVYEPVHDGWEFTNMGGRAILDYVGELAEASAGNSVLELCSGLGATCCYLAEKFDCQVTGIELNRHQLGHALQRIERDPKLAEKVEFVEGDVRHWKPAQLFDVAFTLDSLMLVNSVDEILLNVHSALKPGGVVVLTEMTSGPNVTDELLKIIWRIDGMITVPPPLEYQKMLTAAGFSDIEIADVTFLAEDCFRQMAGVVQTQKEKLLEIIDETEIGNWEKLTRFYLDCFRNEQFSYSRITARR
ncbi:MAG TPA: methyltransferase domain-containing protein [Pyrinomonadaceae bacterium]|nr:methyltransferase domain-containing protein [Pyrinomonadaceae bacterium]